MRLDAYVYLQQVSGIWAQNLDDVTCTSINHKHRLIAFGRRKYVTKLTNLLITHFSIMSLCLYFLQLSSECIYCGRFDGWP
jgi:hypothetical protein